MSNRILGGRYEIQEKIGEGGMAVVHKARCRLLNRNVAVKILKPEFVNDTRVVESFRRESQSAASLAHHNIVNVYDVGKEGNIHYIVMEYIEGETLYELIKREGKLDPDRAVSFAMQIASALGHAHKNHIIHRDVKPHNILITEDGAAKITDFGIAKAVNTETIVNNNSVMGSVHYFSPEQARGGYIDEKSDIYSLGIVLYEMITGKTPFDADNPVAVAMMHINDPMTPPSVLNPRTPMYIEKVIMKATQKVQINRYKTAQEMYDALAGQDVKGMVNHFFHTDNRSDTMVVPAVFGKSAAGADLPYKESARVSEQEKAYGGYEDGSYYEGDFYEDRPKNSGKEKDVNAMNQNSKKSKGIILTIGKKKVKIDTVKFSAIILAIIAAVFMSKGIFFLKDAFVSEPVKVPRLLGMTYEQGKTKLAELGLKCPPLEEIEQVFNDEYKEGEIISQEPQQDTLVKKDFTVKFVLSKGANELSVPNLIGRTREEAVSLIEERDFEAGEVRSEQSEMPIGTVLRQDPEAGEMHAKGASIDLVVSEGRPIQKVPVPNIVGKNIEEATKQLEQAKLSLGETFYDFNNNYELNQVYYQGIAAGQSVDEGTAINIMISKGSGDAGEPREFTFLPDYTLAANNVFTMRIYRSQNGGRDLVYEGVHSKDSSSGLVTVEGNGKAKIIVYFDDKLVIERNVDFETGQFID